MRIVSISPQPADNVPYWSAAPGGGAEPALLPVHIGEVAGLPDSLDGLIVASDLQGAMTAAQAPVLLGEELSARLELLLEVELPEIDPRRVLALLCGDLYADPAVRGSSGDPLPVWRSLGRSFGWVAGVAGNHDRFAPQSANELAEADRTAFFAAPGVKTFAGVELAGLGGITGRPGRPNRMPEREFMEQLERLLRTEPEILLLHQGPDAPEAGCRGDSRVRGILEAARTCALVCCGHVHWEEPLVEIGGVQVLNADGRAFVFRRRSAPDTGGREPLTTAWTEE
ncbi:metallophosphoesterase [Saccharibacillus sp. CPCC 101409]|uniref:metallophosphoesterase family protein n=1 Tax=Saccharibacillus sp. CPCC 101409 TaxID=3058041 RepID=UPI0026735920|nr:metallophosphoesterase [Saccharibacillus sp. CPCC 101409]MDO3409625.1 metallophosphoesterase [Saccharibacillus sp. CPCC 101409]